MPGPTRMPRGFSAPSGWHHSLSLRSWPPDRRQPPSGHPERISVRFVMRCSLACLLCVYPLILPLIHLQVPHHFFEASGLRAAEHSVVAAIPLHRVEFLEDAFEYVAGAVLGNHTVSSTGNQP